MWAKVTFTVNCHNQSNPAPSLSLLLARRIPAIACDLIIVFDQAVKWPDPTRIHRAGFIERILCKSQG